MNEGAPARPSISVEFLLYGALLVLAAWVRLVQLDWLPLSDSEAAMALAASAGAPSELGNAESPAYHALTSMVFAVSGEGEGAARWAPALAGIALVLTPVLLRRQLGRGPVFVAAALLAFSPALWTASRTASGTTIAALGIMAAMFLFIGGRRDWAAAFLGVALVAGPAALTGLATVGAGAGLFALLKRRRGPRLTTPFSSSYEPWWRGLAIVGVVALMLLGLFPNSIGGVFEGLGEWLGGWFQSSGISALTLLIAMFAYEPLVTLIGGFGVVRRLRIGSPVEVWMATWALGALLVLLLYQGRQPADIVWAVLPLTMLAGLVIGDLLNRVVQPESPLIALAFTAAIVALAAFAFLSLRGSVSGPNSFQVFLGVSTNLLAALMGVLLAVLALALLSVGWAGASAVPVAGAAALVILAALSLSAGVGLNFGEAAPSGRELWRSQTSTLGLQTLGESLRTISSAETGRRNSLPVELRDSPTPALAWELRDYPEYQSGGQGSPVVIVREGADLPGDYLGQSVTIGESWGWLGVAPPDLLAWWLNRELPVVPDRWVLLVRKDVARVEEVLPLELDP